MMSFCSPRTLLPTGYACTCNVHVNVHVTRRGTQYTAEVQFCSIPFRQYPRAEETKAPLLDAGRLIQIRASPTKIGSIV
jgi:hypothetical protein